MRGGSQAASQGESLLDNLVTMLGDLEKINQQRILEEKQEQQVQRSAIVVVRFTNPQTLDGIVDRLNQWIETESPDEKWKLDPLFQTLPEPLRRQTQLAETLGGMKFNRASAWPGFAYHDGWALQEAFWLRDAAQYAAGDKIDSLNQASRLFDWTVRNIQLEDPNQPVSGADGITWAEVPLQPWHALLLGRGLAEHRAWVFMLLARQQGLDVVMLGLADGEDAEIRDWIPALVADGQLYLFEPRLGLPVPGPDGHGVATLKQALDQPEILANLDVPDFPYPVHQEQLQNARRFALLEASPLYLSHRGQILQSQVPSNRRPVLSTNPTTVAERVQKAAGDQVQGVKLWQRPYRNLVEMEQLAEPSQRQLENLLRPFELAATLWNGRVKQVRGQLEGSEGALHYYLESHPPDEIIDTAPGLTEPLRRAWHLAKGHAEYWFGVIDEERGNHLSAMKHLYRWLESSKHTTFRSGAYYTLGRACESLALKEQQAGHAEMAQEWLAKAVEAYSHEEVAASPQRAGNLLRAKQLQASFPPKATDSP